MNEDYNSVFSLIKKNMTNKNSKVKINYDLNDKNPTMKYNVDKLEDLLGHLRSILVQRGYSGKITRCCVYCCFCCTRRRKIIQNVLLDEGMNIISEKLDIFNIFEQLYKNEINYNKEKIKLTDVIKMSNSCIFKLNSFNKKLYLYSDNVNS